MNERRYQKQLRQLELAQRATALQQMFGPEAQSRERLAGEQARAAFYANEAFAREQQRLARDEPLRQRQYLAETLGKEQMQRESDAALPNSRAAQERQQRQQENAARQLELDFANKTLPQRLQEYASRVGLAQAQTELQKLDLDFARNTAGERLHDYENQVQYGTRKRQQETELQKLDLDFARASAKERLQEYASRVSLAQTQAEDAVIRAREFKMTQQPRIEDALLQPFVTREQLNALRTQTRGMQQGQTFAEAQENRNAQLFQYQQDAERIRALQTLQSYAAMQGPTVEVDGKKVPQGVDVASLLTPAQRQAYQMLLPARSVNELSSDVLTTLQTLKNEELATQFLDSVPQRRPFSQAYVPGTVDSGSEITRLLRAMSEQPDVQWPDEALALREIMQNPKEYGMYEFFPDLIEPRDFALALEKLRERQSLAK